jgi:dihydroorotase
VKIQIIGARVIDPASKRDSAGSIFIADGKIAALDNAPDGFRADETIDAKGLVACPGLIDLSARLREPGSKHRATLETEMRAAVLGGITTLVCPPDTDPPLDEPGLVEMLRRRAASIEGVRVLPLGALTVGLRGERLAEMARLADAGCVGFYQGDAPMADTATLLQAMRYAATFGYTVWLRAQDNGLAAGGVAHEGEVATRLGLPPIPAIAETIALRTIFDLVETTGARVHVARISAGRSVELVAEAKRRGLPVTCDIGIHHVHLCDRDIADFDSNANLVPPLRDPGDRDRLRRALADGTIDAICSDHTPVDEDMKQVPFGEAEPGASALELLLPLALKWAAEMKLKPIDALGTVTSRAAAVLGLEAARIAPGAAADLCLYDPGKPWVVLPSSLASQGKNTPFLGFEVTGRVARTIVAGRSVHID